MVNQTQSFCIGTWKGKLKKKRQVSKIRKKFRIKLLASVLYWKQFNGCESGIITCGWRLVMQEGSCNQISLSEDEWRRREGEDKCVRSLQNLWHRHSPWRFLANPPLPCAWGDFSRALPSVVPGWVLCDSMAGILCWAPSQVSLHVSSEKSRAGTGC